MAVVTMRDDCVRQCHWHCRGMPRIDGASRAVGAVWPCQVRILPHRPAWSQPRLSSTRTTREVSTKCLESILTMDQSWLPKAPSTADTGTQESRERTQRKTPTPSGSSKPDAEDTARSEDDARW